MANINNKVNPPPTLSLRVASTVPECKTSLYPPKAMRSEALLVGSGSGTAERLLEHF